MKRYTQIRRHPENKTVLDTHTHTNTNMNTWTKTFIDTGTNKLIYKTHTWLVKTRRNTHRHIQKYT